MEVPPGTRVGRPRSQPDGPVVDVPVMPSAHHVWVCLERYTGRRPVLEYPGLVLGWRRSADEWEAHIVWTTPAGDRGRLSAHMGWVPSFQLRPDIPVADHSPETDHGREGHPPGRSDAAGPVTPRVHHVWVSPASEPARGAPAEHPGLILGWLHGTSGWEAHAVWTTPVGKHGRITAHMGWVASPRLRPADPGSGART